MTHEKLKLKTPAVKSNPQSKSTRKPVRHSGAYVVHKRSNTQHNQRNSERHRPPAPLKEEPQRLDIDKIFVHRLAPSGLAYQISMAAHFLVAVGEGYSLQQLFAQVKIDEAARPNVQRLTFDALRHWGTTQFWINTHVSNPPAEWIQAVLCVALTQLLLREENEFTLVNEAVIAIDNNKPHAKGMVNAILRRFLRERDGWIALAQTNDVAQFNHPQWWIDTLKAQYPNDWQHILMVNNTRPPMTLRVNARQHSTADYQALLQANGKSAHTSVLSAQALILDVPCPVTELPEFLTGAVSVQDAGAQLSAQLLAVQDGQNVLDACAAPGGKTAHLLELHHNIQLTALEKDAVRTDRIYENLDRLKLSAKVIINDANNVHQWWDGKPFERILLDAPCSASGIVRRHPDIRWLREADDLVGLAQQQAMLLRTMWQVLAVGGRLVYCTCSIFTTECHEIIDGFMQHTPNARRIYPNVLAQLQHSEVLGQLLPTATEVRNHDGFFYAILEKTDAPIE